MKNIEIDEGLYQYIASNTQYIGESASSILRRLLDLSQDADNKVEAQVTKENTKQPKELVEEVTLDKTPENDTKNDEVVVEKKVKEKTSSQSVFNVINKEELAMQRGAVGRFLLILAAIHRVHQDDFSAVCQIRGRDRLYFAKSEAELTASGSSTKPRQIPDSPYWVITNSNTTRKKMMLTEVASEMGYSAEEIENIRDLL